MPSEEDDFDAAPAAKDEKPAKVPSLEVEAPKSRFPARMVSEAERYGITPEEIESCGSVADLRALVEYERQAERDRQASRAGRSVGEGTRGPFLAESPAEPPLPTPKDEEEEWEFEEDLSWADERVQKELKRIGKEAKKATSPKAKKSLEARLEAAEARIAAMAAENDPVVRRAHAACAKYPALFGDSGNPEDGTPEKARLNMLLNYLFGPGGVKEQGKLQGSPEKDIPAAVAILFPGHGAKAVEAPEPKAKITPPNGTSRIKEWSDAGQAAPTNRNGADKSGVPGGTKGAEKVVAAKLKEMGMPTDGGSDDDDEDF